MRIVDLSATIVPTTPELPPVLRVDVEYGDHAHGAREIESLLGVGPELLRDGEGWATEQLRLGTHNTTHVDAPWHYNSRIAGRPAATIDELPLEWFYAPGVVLDMTAKRDGEAVTAADVEIELERIGHRLAAGEIVLVRSGRDAHYGADDYIARGPGVSVAATRWLYEHGIRVMGIDAWGWDVPLHLQAAEARERRERGIFWAAHQADLAYCQIERLVNLGELPHDGFHVACFPLKVARGSAGPARAVALLPA